MLEPETSITIVGISFAILTAVWIIRDLQKTPMPFWRRILGIICVMILTVMSFGSILILLANAK
jgi:uncharacterized protein YacL